MMTVSEVDPILLDVLKSDGGWMTRGELAAALGISQMYPYYLERLEWMEDKGYIEIDTRTRGLAQKYFVYRAI